jgi:transcriptional regulator with XRE-family HTH domain
LANAAGVSLATVQAFERGRTTPIQATLTVMQQALEAAGVIFIEENGDGAGVRLRKEGTDD